MSGASSSSTPTQLKCRKYRHHWRSAVPKKASPAKLMGSSCSPSGRNQGTVSTDGAECMQRQWPMGKSGDKEEGGRGKEGLTMHGQDRWRDKSSFRPTSTRPVTIEPREAEGGSLHWGQLGAMHGISLNPLGSATSLPPQRTAPWC